MAFFVRGWLLVGKSDMTQSNHSLFLVRTRKLAEYILSDIMIALTSILLLSSRFAMEESDPRGV